MKLILTLSVIFGIVFVGCASSSNATPSNSSGSPHAQNSNSGGNNGGNSSENTGAPHVKIPGYANHKFKGKLKPSYIPNPPKKQSKIPIKPHIPPLPKI